MAEEHEHRTEDEVLEEQAVEDLDVPDAQHADVAGGTGGSGGEDRPTENITLN